MRVDKNTAKEIIFGTNGKLFSVTFIKKDGSVRDMVCRLGVAKHTKGGVSKTAHIPNLITVFEMVPGDDKPRFRNVNVDTIQNLKVNGEVFTIAEESN